ncbi:MAG TPA: hypothetical protein VGK47_07670 [Nitrososphaeraceae archaeon]
MNLQQERIKQDRREELLRAIEVLDIRYNTRLGLADEARHIPTEKARWTKYAEMSRLGRNRLIKKYKTI